MDERDKVYYWKGQTYLLESKIADDKDVVDLLEKAKGLLEKSIEENDSFGDSYRVLAEVYMNLIENRGRFFCY